MASVPPGQFQCPPAPSFPYEASSIAEEASTGMLDFMHSLFEGVEAQESVSSSLADDELYHRRAEIDTLNRRLRLARLQIEALRRSLETATFCYQDLEVDRNNKLRALAPLTAGVTLPIEILSYIYALAYDSNKIYGGSAIIAHMPPATELWEQKTRRSITVVFNADDEDAQVLRQTIIASEPANLAILAYSYPGELSPDGPSLAVKVALEYADRWRELDVHEDGDADIACQLLRQCAPALPRLEQLTITEKPMSWGMDYHPPTSSWWGGSQNATSERPRLRSAWIPLAYLPLSGGLFSSLVNLSVSIKNITTDVYPTLCNSFISLPSLKTLKISWAESARMPDRYSTAHPFFSQTDLVQLPNLEEIEIVGTPPYCMVWILQCLNPGRLRRFAIELCKGIPEIVDDKEISEMLGMLAYVSTRWPALPELSLGTTMEVAKARSSWSSVENPLRSQMLKRRLLQGVLSALGKTHNGQWLFPRLTHFTTPFREDETHREPLLGFARTRRSHQSLATLDMVELFVDVYPPTDFSFQLSVFALEFCVRNVIVHRVIE